MALIFNKVPAFAHLVYSCQFLPILTPLEPKAEYLNLPLSKEALF